MKRFYQIFVIIFVLLSLFIIRNDLKNIYNRVVSYIHHPSEINNLLSSTIEKSKEVVPLPQSVNISGPLKVLNNLVNPNDQITLSAKNIITLTNKTRSDNGNLSLLKENSKLNFSAEKKLQDMFMKQYFEHVSPSGVGVGDLAKEISYEYVVIGENLAMGNFKDDQALMDAWMASPGHRANILNKHYSEIGVAVGKGMFNGQEVWMAVTHFGLPKSACPSIDSVLHQTITIEQKQAKDMESDLAIRQDKINSGVIDNGLDTNAQIDQYNIIVANHNQLVADIKNLILKYNNQVKAYNSCITNNTN